MCVCVCVCVFILAYDPSVMYHHFCPESKHLSYLSMISVLLPGSFTKDQ